MKKPKLKKIVKSPKPKVPKLAKNFDCASVKQAEAKTGFSRDLILALKDLNLTAFHPSGRVDSARLVVEASIHPELVKLYHDVPNIKIEKALSARIDRKQKEVALEETFNNIAPLDLCRRIMTRGGALLRAKLMAIPDRTSEIFSLEQDSLKIRERMIQELADALRALSGEGIEKIIKEVLEP